MMVHAKSFIFIRLGAVFVIMAFLGGCATIGRSTPPVTVAEIEVWSQAGMPPSEIVHRMQKAGDVYRLSASQLADLRSQGVDNMVINYMQQTYLREQRLQGRFEGYGCCSPHLGFGDEFYGSGIWMGY
ncbi:MAG: hypothetical protein KGI54_07285 [Pseudomonadota bacterium]|nr:hypothetical protein [Pseudomonadota bacterium]